MGWTFTVGASKDELVRELVEGYSILDYEVCGDVLWIAADFGHQRVIVCYLMQDDGEGWGYKEIDESMGPFRYDCPLRLLERAPVLNRPWRAKVLAYHARKL